MVAANRNVSFWSSVAVLVALACAKPSAGTHPDATPATAAAETATATSVAPVPPAETAPPASASAAPLASVRTVEPAAPPSAQPASSRAESALAPSRKPPPRTERECKACNGEWKKHGIAPAASCNCRTTDGGKRCRDGAECQGLCVGKDDPEREVVERGPPARGFFVGRCSTFSTVFGCYRAIDDGASARAVELTEPPQMICAD